MNIAPFCGSYPNKALITSPETFFQDVSDEYLNFKKAGFFIQNPVPAIYVYEIKNENSVFTGLITANDIADYDKNKILGHENTIAVKEQEMLKLTLLRKAMIKPVLLGYDGTPKLDVFIESIKQSEKLFFELLLPQNDEWHRLWAIQDKKLIAELQSLFVAEVPFAYIADGHHRTSTAVKLLKDNYLKDSSEQISILAAYFPFRDLKIYEYNRAVECLSNMSASMFMAKLSVFADIKPIKTKRKPNKKHELTMYLLKEWFVINWRKKWLKKFRTDQFLDTDLFNNFILNKILQIDNIKNSSKVKYIEGPAGMDAIQNMVHTNEHFVGFCLFPITVEEMKSVSLANGELPPKSTWFEPRMKNGLMIKEF